MMLEVPKIAILASAIFLTTSCGKPNRTEESVDQKQTYSLCAKTKNAHYLLYDKIRQFSDQQQARFIDRSSGAEEELTYIESGVRNKTGGKSILITVDKPATFRISITNLGLREKLAMAIRLPAGNDEHIGVNRFLAELSQFWTIQVVNGGVTDDPPC